MAQEITSNVGEAARTFLRRIECEKLITSCDATDYETAWKVAGVSKEKTEIFSSLLHTARWEDLNAPDYEDFTEG